MGNCGSSEAPPVNDAGTNHDLNQHTVNPDIKIHSVVSEALDFDHKHALLVPLGETSDEQLLAEVSISFRHNALNMVVLMVYV